MKRVYLTMLSALLVSFLSSCNNLATTPSESSDNASRMITPPSAPLNLIGPRSTIVDGDVIVLYCLGNASGNRYLNGLTSRNGISLAPDCIGVYTGTKWKVCNAGSGFFALECQGNLPGNRYLDGLTSSGATQLAPYFGEIYSGTRWQFALTTVNGQPAYTLKCMGTKEGPRYLDGQTTRNIVTLAPYTDGQYSGTFWAIYKE